MLAYSHLHEDEAKQFAPEMQAAQPHADLVILEGRKGGRAVRLPTAFCDSIVLVFMQSRELLHCNPYPNTLMLPTAPGLLHLRQVFYALHKHDNFTKRVSQMRHLIHHIYRAVDPFYQQRLREEMPGMFA